MLDIETDSTIYPDEMREKASRAEFMQVFSTVMAGVSQLAQLGPQALGLSGAVMKFALAPYRVGRELEGVIDDFIDSAPQIAEQMAAQQNQGGEDQQAMAQLAQAELQKAQAQTMKVQADAQKSQADAELKAAELQGRMQEAQAKVQQDQQRFALEVEKSRGTVEETAARIEKIYAEIKKLGIDTEVSASKERRETVKTAADIQGQQQDRAMAAQGQAQDAAFRAQDQIRAERGEARADRQQAFSERQPPK